MFEKTSATHHYIAKSDMEENT